ncbi:MAG: glycosyltransferase [Saprospiraceae bacterium]
MISIIVCSYNTELLLQLKSSVIETIGVEHEFLIWDNRQENKGICEVYNLMSAKARYPILCFVHEDVLFRSNGWGKYLIELFRDKEYGLVGVAGSKFKSQTLSGWYTGIKGYDYLKIIHRLNGVDKVFTTPTGWNGSEEEVVIIDGVFMVCPLYVWQKVKFDEVNLKGFHFYDIDFAIRVSLIAKVLVTNTIDIVHLTTGGDYGDKWLDQAIIFHQIRRNLLPIGVDGKNVENNRKEIEIASRWLDSLRLEKISFNNKIKWIKLQGLHKHFNLWYPISKFFLYKITGAAYIHAIFRKK